MMNQQEILNFVVPALMKQGPSIFESGGNIRCRYRAEQSDGQVRKCAVGMLIKDEFYYKELEGLGVAECSVRRALESSGMVDDIDSSEVLSLLVDLQRAHDETIWASDELKVDEANFPSRLAARVAVVATNHGLVSPV
jgi:hypothetical protein